MDKEATTTANSGDKKETAMKMDIYQLTELSHVPQVYFDLAMHINIIKTGPMQQKVDDYNQRKQDYYKKMVTEANRESTQNKTQAPLYWFELTYFKTDDWGLGTMKPWPPQFEAYALLMPEVLMNIMAGYEVDSDKINGLEVQLKTPVERKMNLRFVRYSEALIFGTLQEDINDIKDRIWSKEGFTEAELKENPTLPLRILMHRMYQQPDIMKKFVDAYATGFQQSGNIEKNKRKKP